MSLEEVDQNSEIVAIPESSVPPLRTPIEETKEILPLTSNEQDIAKSQTILKSIQNPEPTSPPTHPLSEPSKGLPDMQLEESQSMKDQSDIRLTLRLMKTGFQVAKAGLKYALQKKGYFKKHPDSHSQNDLALANAKRLIQEVHATSFEKKSAGGLLKIYAGMLNTLVIGAEKSKAFVDHHSTSTP